MKTGRIYVALEVTPDGWRCSFSDGKDVVFVDTADD